MKKNSAMASRIVKDTIEEGLIKENDPSSTSRSFHLTSHFGLNFI